MTTIDLKPFCSRDPSRATMCIPSTDGIHTYATNGKLAIRVPFAGGLADPIAGSMQKLFDKLPKLTEPSYEIPSLPEPVLEPCKECDGYGKWRPCQKCDGQGERECDLGHTHTCEDCDGRGWFAAINGTDDCELCGGSGKQEEVHAIRVGVAAFDAQLLRLIGTLPNVRLAVYGPTSEARVMFDGGEGILMPMRLK